MAEKRKKESSLDEIDPDMEKAFSVDGYGEGQLFEDDHSSEHAESSMHVSDVQFPNLSNEEVGNNVEVDFFSNIPIGLSVELGRSQITLKEVFELSEGSIIELERLVGEPLDLVVNGQIIAQGEVVAIDSNYGLRVTSIVSSVKKA
ncbi:MAG: flagellar motor switch protein FliN [bacterium]|nr:flagellar motor switch protein FliN [bacterium]